MVPRKEFVDKVRPACRQRDQSDEDFVIIARSASCRFEGLNEAIARVNAAADNGADMGYKIALDALLYLLVSFNFAKCALYELKASGDFTGLSARECVTARRDIETLVGLDEYYAIEGETVEEKNGVSGDLNN